MKPHSIGFSILVWMVCCLCSSTQSDAQPPPMRFGTATILPSPVNDPSRIDFSMDLSTDGRELYYCSTASFDTWVARRDDVRDDFGEPQWVTSGCGPSLSPNGLTLFVSQNGEFGNEDIFQLGRASLDAEWGEPENMGAAINSDFSETSPDMSPDGRTLSFIRGTPNGNDNRIWQATRDDVTQSFGTATRIRASLTNDIAVSVNVTPDNLKLLFSTPAGDFYVASRKSESDDWSRPQYLSREVNSSRYEWNTNVSADGRTLYFDRLAPGGTPFGGPYDIWQVPIFPSGDFDDNWQLDAADIDALAMAIRAQNNPPEFDLDGQGTVDDNDVNVWVHDIRKTWMGDANLDGEFNSSDLVGILASGAYEADVDAVWATGDFNGDLRANTADLVVALADGGYEQGPRAARVAPEPGGALLMVIGIVGWMSQSRQRAASSRASSTATA